MSARGPYRLPSGAILQSGLAQVGRVARPANGLQLRGVVLDIHLPDDPLNPENQFADPSAQTGLTTAVYVDVLCYSTVQGFQKIIIKNVLLSQEVGGIHAGKIWIPRASSQTVSGKTFNPIVQSISDLDGDHVLLGFVDNDLGSPVVLRGLPHAFADAGQGEAQPTLAANMRITSKDGQPSLTKQNGSFFGITKDGDFIANTCYASDGRLGPKSTPPAPPTTGDYGNLLEQLHSHAQRLTRLIDMSNPAKPVDVAQEILTATSYTLKFLSKGTGQTLAVQGQDANATMQVGDGAVHAAIAEHLETFYSTVQNWLATHTHSTTTGPSGPALSPPPEYDTSINSQHLAFPDG